MESRQTLYTWHSVLLTFILQYMQYHDQKCSLNSSWPHIYKQSAAKREAAVLSANFWYHSWYQVFSTKLQLRWCRTWLATWSEYLLWLINLHKNRWPLLLDWPAFIVSMKHAFFNQILAAQSVWSYWKKKVKKLAETYNRGLLKSKDMEPFKNDEDLFEEDSNATPVRSMNVTDAESFYSSTEWIPKVDNILYSYPRIPLPSKPNHSVYSLQPPFTSRYKFTWPSLLS